MARRNTPPRGSGPPLYGSGSRPLDRGRPTVQELSALEVVAAVERAREQQRQRGANPEPKAEARIEEQTVPDIPATRRTAADTLMDPAPRHQGLTPLRAAEPLPRIEEFAPELSERPTLQSDLSDLPLPDLNSSAGRSLVLSGASREQPLSSPYQDEYEPPRSSVRALPQRSASDADLRLVLKREPDSARAAAFRVLRYRIEQQQGDDLGTRVIALCAPRSGQGVTTAAANLALALSECDRARVCIIEGNLRRPALSHLFRFKPPMCLVDRLARDRDEPTSPWCVAELSPSLHVLAVREGALRRPLIDGPAFAAAVDALRRSGYRYVIIDGPEVLGIADMNLIEETADDVLLVAKGGTTTAADLKTATSQLSNRKLRGVVMLDSA